MEGAAIFLGGGAEIRWVRSEGEIGLDPEQRFQLRVTQRHPIARPDFVHQNINHNARFPSKKPRNRFRMPI